MLRVTTMAAAALLTWAAASGDPGDQQLSSEAFPCEHPIYCHGRLLKTVQLSQIFNDSKWFVDMPCNGSVLSILAAANSTLFARDTSPTAKAVANFVATHFLPPNSDLVSWIPQDWQPSPPGISRINDPMLNAWAHDLNSRWRMLGRATAPDVAAHPERHSLIDVPNPFIVPGGRFREFYYWDTFWIIKGMLLCGMTESALGMIRNFGSLVDRYGFVPNGGRRYYTRRSQPPFLTLMAATYFNATKSYSFVRAILPQLVREHSFWELNRSIAISLQDGTVAKLNRFSVNVSSPRPESFREDWLAAGPTAMNRDAILRWSELASGAETGWDFSSRWLRDAQNISSIATSAIVPVDLNAILYKVEVELAALHDAVGLTNASLQYSRRAAQRKSDVERVLWDQNRSMWADFNLTCRCKTNFMFASQFVPVYAGLADDWSNVTAESWSNQLIRGGWFDHFSGVPTSLMQSGQQWDFPNVWPPLVSMATFGLRRIGQHALAFHIAQSFVNSSYVGWADSPNHYMFEKYDARTVGQSGSGGEYVPQNGFGWTNGVVLELLVNFTSLKAPLLRDSTIQAMTSAVVVDYSDGGASSSGINSSTTAAPKPEVTKVDESGWSSPMIIALGCGATIAIVVGATLWVKGACTESITPVVNAAKPNDVDDHEDVEMTYLCPSSSEITYEDEDDAPILQ